MQAVGMADRTDDTRTDPPDHPNAADRRDLSEVGLSTKETYCPSCESVAVVVTTVPWQDDQCRMCGGAVPDG